MDLIAKPIPKQVKLNPNNILYKLVQKSSKNGKEKEKSNETMGPPKR